MGYRIRGVSFNGTSHTLYEYPWVDVVGGEIDLDYIVETGWGGACNQYFDFEVDGVIRSAIPAEMMPASWTIAHDGNEMNPPQRTSGQYDNGLYYIGDGVTNGTHVVVNAQMDVCDNVPDGLGLFGLIGVDVNGQRVAETKSINWMQVTHSFDFSGVIQQCEGGIQGYLIRAPKGFTAGSVVIDEYWTTPGGLFSYVRNTFTISLSEFQKQGQNLTPHWAVGVNTEITIPVPVVFSGIVNVTCSFAALPECMDEVSPDENGETAFEEAIEEIEVEEPEGEPGIYPPVEPEQPDVIEPPEPPETPESGCECDIYLAQVYLEIGNKIVECFNALNKTIHENSVYIGDAVEYNAELVSGGLQMLEEKLKLPACEPEFPEGETITQVVDRFVGEYQPGVVEVLESEVVVNGDDVYSRRKNY